MSLLFTLTPVSWFSILFVFLCGYLSGSVPYGLLLGKLAGLGDIRKAGSGNIGATNVLRLGGKKLAIATLLLDALKGAVPVLIAASFHKDYAVMAALGAFVGHLFPVWLKFKGGKGVAVALGVIFALSWKIGLILILIWLACALFTQYSSASALAASGFAPIVTALLTADPQLITFMLIISVAIWVKHRENIKRLAAGTEGKINLGSKK